MRFAAAALALALSLAAGAASAGPPSAGSWFGKGEPGDKEEYWLARLGAGGSFQALFRSCAHGKAHDEFEHGRWAVDKSGILTTTASADGSPVEYTDSYTTLSNDGGVWRYRLSASSFPRADIGFAFTSRRVGDDFELPECGPDISLLLPRERRA